MRRPFLQSLPLLLAVGIVATLLIAYGSIAWVDLSTVAPTRSVRSYDGRVQWSISFVSGPAATLVSVQREVGIAWCVDQACGPPNSPAGDQHTAWASESADGTVEWLELGYDHPIQPTAIEIHESYNPGAIVMVTIFDATSGEEEVVWRGTPSPTSTTNNTPQVRRLVLPIATNRLTKRVRLDLDSPAVPGWNEIDAVALIDSASAATWASSARASTTYRGGTDGDQAAASALPWWANLPPEPKSTYPVQNRTQSYILEGRGWPMAALRVEHRPVPAGMARTSTRPIVLGIVIDILFFAALFAGVRWLATYPKKFIVESARLRRGHCMLCGYDLQYNFPAGCPECGWRRDVPQQ